MDRVRAILAAAFEIDIAHPLGKNRRVALVYIGIAGGKRVDQDGHNLDTVDLQPVDSPVVTFEVGRVGSLEFEPDPPAA